MFTLLPLDIADVLEHLVHFGRGVVRCLRCMRNARMSTITMWTDLVPGACYTNFGSGACGCGTPSCPDQVNIPRKFARIERMCRSAQPSVICRTNSFPSSPGNICNSCILVTSVGWKAKPITFAANTIQCSCLMGSLPWHRPVAIRMVRNP